LRTYANEEYLRAENLLKNGRYLTTRVTVSDIVKACPKGGGKDDKQTKRKMLGLAFEGKDRVLGLNATNYGVMCWEHGEGNPIEWVGKKVTLSVRLYYNKKTKVLEPAIRILPTRPLQNVRLIEQMGIEIDEEWYAANMPEKKVEQ